MLVDLSCATIIDDISRIQIFSAPPSVAEVVLKMNRAHSLLEESFKKSDWTLNASKTANVIAMRGEGANATTTGLTDKRRGLRGVACSEARLLGPYLKSGSGTKRMETMRTILEGKSTEEGKTTHVHLLRARGCSVGTDESGAGTKTLCIPGQRSAGDAEESVRGKGATNVERNQGSSCRWYQSWARQPKDHHAVVTKSND